MTGRRLFVATILLLLAVNTWSGLAKVMAFRHRYAGERSLAAANLNDAFSSLGKAADWQPGDAPTYVLMGTVVQRAQANGLPLEALEGHEPAEMFSVGLSAVARGIALNPADAWGWFNVANLCQGFRSAQVRYERMRRAGEAARGGEAPRQGPDDAEAAAGLDPLDAAAVAAVLKARELEPAFFFYGDFLAKLYWERGLPREAAREIRDSFALTPRLPAHPMLEIRGLAADLADPVLEGIDRAGAAGFVEEVTVLRARAEMLVKVGRVEPAIEAYERLKAAGGTAIRAECDLALGKLEQRRGRYSESIEILNRAVESGTDNAWGSSALYYLGLAYSRLGQERVAADYYRRYLALEPGVLSGYWALAASLEALGESGEAEGLYVAAVRRFPDLPETYARAIAHMRRHGRAREAIAYAEGLRKVDPGDDSIDDLIRELREEASSTPIP